ncbi:MAG: zinc-binding dehydrogenase [Kiritimatiellae bacterium]|nr:zinc-binding dehydrogenase [Kiritimatiellia bacterium]
MKAIIVTAEHRAELQDIPRPACGPYEALVRIEACGICSTTDRELIAGTQLHSDRYPCVLGHEAVGKVVETGCKVRSFTPGDRVTRPVGIWPGSMRDGLASAWGGFAEYGIVRDRQSMLADGDRTAARDYTAQRQNVVRPGAELRDAVLAISLGETASWFRHLPGVAGKTVCIAGTGIAGLSIAIWSRLAGARCVVVLGRRDTRTKLACELGADHGVNVRGPDPVQAVRELTGGGADLFCEAVGKKDQLRLGLAVLKRGGTLAVYAAPPRDGYDLCWRDLPPDVRIVQPPAEEHLAYGWALDLLQRGIVPADRLMTHSWPLHEHLTAFDGLASGDVVKGMLTPHTA